MQKGQIHVFPFAPLSPSADQAVRAYEDLLRLSARVRYKFPTSANLIQNLDDVSPRAVGLNALNTHPILHLNTLQLIEGFLALKREHGTEKERALYAQLTIEQFIDRMLINRPLAFFMPRDQFLLKSGLDGACGMDAAEGFGRVGTDSEDELRLADVLSYDEMAVSALLSVSTATHFINSGARGNRGRPGESGTFESKGVYVGMVGARFERPGQVEYAHCLVTHKQNTEANGYGPSNSNPLLKLWANFYGCEYFPTYQEVCEEAKKEKEEQKKNFLELVTTSVHNVYLNIPVYKQRLRIVIQPFLQDANRRAQEAGKLAYVHVVGLGLGVWAVSSKQAGLMMEVYSELLRELSLPCVADLDFSYFPPSIRQCGGVEHEQMFEVVPPNSQRPNSVRVHFSKRDPADVLREERLLVAMYAWDGNAMPGNEYWLGLLTASGDPAAACCSGIPQLQNPDINKAVCGRNALVYDNLAAWTIAER